ncbi:P-loop containing nucleoside triphosphate hydrolase protein [Leucogyrophana mollusca]|uniref:P-loop containing nucleoside triphosphate hydrolase protein n=1 Tax=Leucogyrophana mollusca TaxID=85980 RepID=A0ACB8B597_9AGAM|nr:P-loop containing nucleoside triphosphate hydrolase protein [Leucogyrophana mollusca]
MEHDHVESDASDLFCVRLLTATCTFEDFFSRPPWEDNHGKMKRKDHQLEVGQDESNSTTKKPVKKARTGSTTARKGKGKEKQDIVWPDHFQDALNTVLAFVSSRKHMATTFPAVRSSVEGLLKRPLALSKVAELKALLPELIKFAYIPPNELRIHAETVSQLAAKKGRASPDFSMQPQSTPSGSQIGLENDEHVLILEFAENSRGKKEQAGPGLSLPPSLTPAALKKLVEKRNERFSDAVNELITATPIGEDPVALLQVAAHEHIPVNPSSTQAKDFEWSGKLTVPEHKDRPSIDAVISEIQEQSWYTAQIVDRRTFEAKEAREGILDVPLSATIQQALRDSRKITSLYIHQTAAINAISKGRHVIVSTSTASGKSVIYQIPLLRYLEDDHDATAIFVYPTKALAQDQKAALEQLLWACPGLQHVATYDGDTPQETRAAIRESASVIFTNFDMMHASILPHEDLWRNFMRNLKLVAIDELHYYSDIFGSHVAQVLRRFRRVCAAVGNRRMRFVSCSATISKPSQHMKRLFGIDDVEAITEDGAPSGCKDFLVWDPPPVDPKAPKLGKRSSLSEATGLMRFLMKRGVRVILFCKIRKVCELAMKTLRADLSAEGRLDVLTKVMPYRGEDRRRIEHEAFSGNLLGIVATNALELGVDIGVLDAVIMLGFPFGIANFRQQAGRAGRRARDSLAVLVADGLPLDQHYVNNPDELFDKAVDDLMVDLDSEVILEAHLQCAAHEMPLSKDDGIYFGPALQELCDSKLLKDKDGWYHTHPKYLPFPAKHIHLRGAEEDKYTVVDISSSSGPKILEELEVSRALFEIYEGGVFMHQGLTFIVKEVSHDSKTAKLVRADVNWTTNPSDVDAKQTYRIKEIMGSPHRSFYGRFYKIRNKSILDTVDLDTPPWERQVSGFWLDVPKNILSLLRAKLILPAAAIHSAQHAWLNQFALSADLRTECKAAEKEYKTSESRRKRPARLIFHDGSENSGVSAKAFDHVHIILRQAHDAVETCHCEDGCTNCILSARCKENNTVASKIGALLILRGLLDLEINADSIPVQRESTGVEFDTVEEAGYVRPVDGVQVEAP